MKANYVHKDTLTTNDYVELNKNNELLISYNQALLKENRKLKKQVEENKDNYNCLLKQKEQFEYIMSKQVDYQGQQKEFIKYLEDKIKLYKNDIQNFSKNYNVYFSLINDLKVGKTRTEEILQKYKRITGVSNEKEN